ncbi:hypothetical protein L1049_011080 [Liquidambar formosana]|uniref:Uncharacterized protein n=1 Tax=Liquidambar formosana TaxID=63359 RepID=A0AAP0RW44_LIQFO
MGKRKGKESVKKSPAAFIVGVLGSFPMLIFRAFLWTGSEMKSTGSKLKWSSVCMPKNEGGLGIRRIADINIAAAMKHIWQLFQQAGSLWVAWAHLYLIKDKCFWSLPIPSDCSWTWRQLLKIRDKTRPFIKHIIGNGESTFLWHDHWHPLGPLFPRFGSRVLIDAAIPSNAKFEQLITMEERKGARGRDGEQLE